MLSFASRLIQFPGGLKQFLADICPLVLQDSVHLQTIGRFLLHVQITQLLVKFSSLCLSLSLKVIQCILQVAEIWTTYINIIGLVVVVFGLEKSSTADFKISLVSISV
jgi:hypothetical protein